MDTRKEFFLQLAYFIALTFLISSCGGDGGSSSPSGPITPTAPTFSFTKQMGSITDDYGKGIAVDTSGNIYVTGYTGGGLDGNTSAGGNDIFLVKYDSAGNKQWTRQFGTANNDGGSGVALDSSGNVYVTGFAGGSLDGNTFAGGPNDIFLAKYDSGGNKQWTRLLGSASADYGTGIAIDSSGNIYVTGYTYGDLDGNTNAGPSDIFLGKYDSAGNKQWTRQLGNIKRDSGNAVSVDSAGFIYVTGYTDGGLDTQSLAPVFLFFLAKYDSAGNRVWTWQGGSYSQLGGDSANGVAVDSSGDIYVTGFTWGAMDGNINLGNRDIFLAKFDSLGNKQWMQQRGTANNDDGLGIAVDRSGNIYLTGSTYGSLDGNVNVGGWDIFLGKYSP